VLLFNVNPSIFDFDWLSLGRFLLTKDIAKLGIFSHIRLLSIRSLTSSSIIIRSSSLVTLLAAS